MESRQRQAPRAAIWRPWFALAGLVIVGGFALAFIGLAALASASFEPTDASRFQSWAARPLGTAGGLALGCCVLGLVTWFLSRRWGRHLTLASFAVLAGGAVLAWGAVAHAGRAHPEFDRARALQSLLMPVGYIGGPTRLDHPSEVSAPAATRVWSAAVPVTQACGDVAVALAAWADHGSVRRSGPATVPRCYISATKDGHTVDANVTMGIEQVMVSVRLAG